MKLARIEFLCAFLKLHFQIWWDIKSLKTVKKNQHACILGRTRADNILLGTKWQGFTFSILKVCLEVYFKSPKKTLWKGEQDFGSMSWISAKI